MSPAPDPPSVSYMPSCNASPAATPRKPSSAATLRIRCYSPAGYPVPAYVLHPCQAFDYATFNPCVAALYTTTLSRGGKQESSRREDIAGEIRKLTWYNMQIRFILVALAKDALISSTAPAKAATWGYSGNKPTRQAEQRTAYPIGSLRS